MSRANSLRSKSITVITTGGVGVEARNDQLAVEEPLEVRVGGRSIAVVMRTPGHDRELAAGFLLAEGLIRQRDDVLDIIRCGAKDGDVAQNVVDVILAASAAIDPARLTRHVFTSSSCGICSKASIEAAQVQFAPIEKPVAISARMLALLPARLRDTQAVFAASGGLHAAGLFTSGGTLEVSREDVGRHNAVDKVIGHAFLEDRLPLRNHLLLLSGRVSFELMQKALAGGISCVAAISAPTTAAVEFAEASGQTLVGFLRPAGTEGAMRMNVYAGTLAE